MAASEFLQKMFLLSEVAELSLGYSFRGRIETSSDGPIRLIQMRDLTEDNRVEVSGAARSRDLGFSPSHYLAGGDLVFRARGANNSAAYATALTEPTALASPLIRIRVKDRSLEPQYLKWFINLPSSRTFLGAGSQGSLVRMVSIEHLAKLEVVVPSLEEQRLLASLADLYTQEARILRRLAELRERYGMCLISERIFGTNRSEHGEQD